MASENFDIIHKLQPQVSELQNMLNVIMQDLPAEEQERVQEPLKQKLKKALNLRLLGKPSVEVYLEFVEELRTTVGNFVLGEQS